MTQRFTRVLVAAVVLIGGACGGGSSSKKESAATTASTAAKQDIAADKAAAVAANLTLSDFPSGWTSKAQDNSPGSTAADQEAAKCIGISADRLSGSGPTDSQSPDFSAPDDSTTISSEVELVPDAAMASQELELLSKPTVAGCLSGLLAATIKDEVEHPANPADALPAGVTIGTPTVSKQAVPAGLGDGGVGYRLVMPIKGPGISLAVNADLVFVRKGRAEVMLSFEGVGQPVPADQQAHYAGIVIGRLTRS